MILYLRTKKLRTRSGNVSWTSRRSPLKSQRNWICSCCWLWGWWCGSHLVEEFHDSRHYVCTSFNMSLLWSAPPVLHKTNTRPSLDNVNRQSACQHRSALCSIRSVLDNVNRPLTALDTNQLLSLLLRCRGDDQQICCWTKNKSCLFVRVCFSLGCVFFLRCRREIPGWFSGLLDNS